MKRVVSLLLLFLLLSLAASAETPVYSREMQAQKVAVAAVKVKYGITTDMLGLFSPQITITENETCVAFYPNDYLPVGRIGVYEVVLTEIGRASCRERV